MAPPLATAMHILRYMLLLTNYIFQLISFTAQVLQVITYSIETNLSCKRLSFWAPSTRDMYIDINDKVFKYNFKAPKHLQLYYNYNNTAKVAKENDY